MTEAEVDAVQLSLRRQRPFGTATWTQTTAETLGLGFTLRNPGRPRGGNPDDKTTQTT